MNTGSKTGNRSRSGSRSSQIPVSQKLFVNINVHGAADLVDSSVEASNGKKRSKSINPVLLASLNGTTKKTKRKISTNHPSWDDQLSLPLKFVDNQSSVLTLTVWDKHRGYKNYLGELRLKLTEVFAESVSTELKWYKLYSSKSFQSFITGSVLVSFELVVKEKRSRHRRSSSKPTLPRDLAKNPDVEVVVQPPTPQGTAIISTDSLNKQFNDLGVIEELAPVQVSVDKRIDLFKLWRGYLNDGSGALKADDQGFYSDSDFQSDFSQEVSDIESVSRASLQSSKESNDDVHLEPSQLIQQKMSNNLESDVSSMNSFTEGSILSSEIDFSDSADLNSDVPAPPSIQISQEDGHKSRRSRLKKRFGSRKSKLKRHMTKLSHFEVKNLKVNGVLFLEVVSCSGLPPFRNLMRLGFDMDPFVVVTFGKKTFRTSWKRHTLNPVFNERLAFEVLESETNYDIHFLVLDKDRFSLHDDVASVSIPLRDIMTSATASSPPPKKSQMHLNPSIMDSSSSLSSFRDDFTDSEHPKNSSISMTDNPNIVESMEKTYLRGKKLKMKYSDTSKFKTMNLALKIGNEKYKDNYNPTLKVRARYETYNNLRKQFWARLLTQYNINDKPEQYDYIELISLLDTLGCANSDEIVNGFFAEHSKSAWGGDTLTTDQIIACLESHIASNSESTDKLFMIERCPNCLKKKLNKKHDIDIITHFAICGSKDWSIVNKLLVASYVSPQLATKRWFSKILIKISYGKYQLGSNSANILVQDRLTGVILEEKIGVYVRLGIRLLYQGLDTAKRRRVRALMKKLSIKQGVKFDSPQSRNDIPSFIKFHKLNLDDCLETDPDKYETFNEFFYRKLKPDARPVEAEDNEMIATSPADCRCTAFDTVDSATEFWIKGRNFTIAKLFNGNFYDLENSDIYKKSKCSLGIFRLAPQDYHRFHSPVTGVIKKIKFIDGEYYTVNPMAIRSELDVFGENIRAIIAIETESFGTVIMIPVGAMMVGSTVLTKGENDHVKKGEEVGYFKFGGSTIILLFEHDKFQFDSDLISNSRSSVETLVRVGQSIGHSPDEKPFRRDKVDFEHLPKDTKRNLIRVITGGDLDAGIIESWETNNLKISESDVESIMQENDIESLAKP